MAQFVPSLEEHFPSLLSLDSYCLLHVAHFLESPRDLAALQQTCTLFFRLLQPSSSWAHVLKLKYGFQVSSRAADSKALLKLLHTSRRDLHSVRFTAVLTDGGVDVGSLHYWADHLFIPNAWAPYCAKYANNVNCLAVLKTGPSAYNELTHRNTLIRCLKWVVPLLQQQAPPQLHVVPDPRRVEAAANLLASWKTLRLESFFCQMAARLAVPDPLGLAMLTGMSGSMEERRNRVQILADSLESRSFYDRAYRLHFLPERPRLQLQQTSHNPPQHSGTTAAGGAGAAGAAAGAQAAGRGPGYSLLDRPYVMDERAVREEMMTPRPPSAVAIIHAMSVSREGRLSCPVLSGVLLAGLLPPGWPDAAESAVKAALQAAKAALTAAGEAPDSLPQLTAGQDVEMASYEALLRATVEQPMVTALNDMQDAESVLTACAAGQLPPWVRHVVLQHVEFIELLPPHLAAELRDGGGAGWTAAQVPGAAAAGAAGSGGGGSGGRGVAAAGGAGSSEDWLQTAGWGPAGAHLPSAVPALHPVVWFRFKDHAGYCRTNPSRRTRVLLNDIVELYRSLASMLRDEMERSLLIIKTHVDAMMLGRPGPHGSEAGGAGGEAAAAADSADHQVDTEAVGAGAAAGSEDSGEDAEGDDALAGSEAAAAGQEHGAGDGDAGGLSAWLRRQPTHQERPSIFLAVKRARSRVARMREYAQIAEGLAEELEEGTAGIVDLATEPLEAITAEADRLEAALVSAATLLDEMDAANLAVTVMEEVYGAGQGRKAVPGPSGESAAVLESSGGDAGMPEEAAAGPSSGAPQAAAVQQGTGVEGEGSRLDLRWFARREYCTKLQSMLAQHESLCEDAVLRRRQLAKVLLQQAGVAAGLAAAKPALDEVREVRNDELLRRLSVQPCEPPQPSPAAAEAEAAEAEPQQPQPQQQAVPAAEAGGGGAAAAAVPTLEPGPPAGWVAEGAFDPLLQSKFEREEVQLPEAGPDEGHRVVHLVAPLLFPVAANVVVFKAVRPENLMSMVGWDDNETPNVDVQYVGLQGRVVRLPPGVQALAAV